MASHRHRAVLVWCVAALVAAVAAQTGPVTVSTDPIPPVAGTAANTAGNAANAAVALASPVPAAAAVPVPATPAVMAAAGNTAAQPTANATTAAAVSPPVTPAVTAGAATAGAAGLPATNATTASTTVPAAVAPTVPTTAAAGSSAIPAAANTGMTPSSVNLTAVAAAAAAKSRASAASSGNLLKHNGQDIFLTGVNLGNVQFLPFEGNPYGYTVQEMRNILETGFADIAATGANSVRFWLHIDGSQSPTWGVQGGQTVVTGLPPSFLEDLKWLLRTAYDKYGILVCVSLWSHDILAVRRFNSVANRARAVQMVSDDAATAAYINNALLPMLAALGEQIRPGGPTYLDAVVSWDVLNEPEGMSRHWRLYKNYMYLMRYGNYTWWNPNTYQLLKQKSANASLGTNGGNYVGWYFYQEDGTFNNYMYHDVFDNYPSEWDFMKNAIVDTKELVTVEIPYTKVLRFINKVAGAIHRAAPGAKVTCGAHSMPYTTDIPMPKLRYDNAPMNYYSDNLLVAAGGDPDGTLDFYAVHGYAIWDEAERDSLINMFRNPYSHWKVNKPILVGEHWEQVMPWPSTVQVGDYTHLYDTGYAGGWGWAWFNVTETFDYNTGANYRRIGEHKCRGSLRSLLSGLPARLKYAVGRGGAQPQGASGPAAVIG